MSGVIKSVFFGVAASLLAVFEGYNCVPTAEGVGRATTRAVVHTSLTVLALNSCSPPGCWEATETMQQTRAVELGTGLVCLYGHPGPVLPDDPGDEFDALFRDEGYDLTARFDQIGTLKVRSPVSISGVQIGRVTAIDFDVERLEAVVTMRLASRYDRIPNDSDAAS
jgi:hypothetical protein